MQEDSKNEKIKEVEKEIAVCQKCPLSKTRKNPVPGKGSTEARIMFVGEGPGYWEDQKGIPFCGAAGKILDELLDSVGLKRNDIYITNVVKCRPTTPDSKNRAPSQEEIKACVPYLERQIQIIKPKIICTLGNYSTAFILEKYGLKHKIEGMTRIHGQVFETRNLFNTIKIIPLYHPAVATYNPNMKKILLQDFQILKNQ
jgi:uracil-DNA glycosylase family 4